MSNMKAYFTNMSAPMPFHKKLYSVLRNSALRIIKRQTCCGNTGQPGC